MFVPLPNVVGSPSARLKLRLLGYTTKPMLHVKVFLFNPIQENTYIVYNDENQAIIIDPGCYHENERQEVARFLEQNHLSLVQLVNTHCHLDHVFGNRYIHETYGLDLHMHPLEKTVLDFAPTVGLMWKLPFDNYDGPFVHLKPGEKLQLGDNYLDILFTPGHSPGSLSFYAPVEGFVIAGDVLFRGGVGRSDLPGGDFNVLAQSIREQLYTLPDETRVLPGHGPETTIGHEKKTNPFVTVEA